MFLLFADRLFVLPVLDRFDRQLLGQLRGARPLLQQLPEQFADLRLAHAGTARFDELVESLAIEIGAAVPGRREFIGARIHLARRPQCQRQVNARAEKLVVDLERVPE